MSKVFDGFVSIVMNTRGEIALRRDPEGKFSAANAAELHATMQSLAKRHKAAINKYALFTADPKGVPVLLANRYGNPYIGLLPPSPQTGGDRPPRRGITKLA